MSKARIFVAVYAYFVGCAFSFGAVIACDPPADTRETIGTLLFIFGWPALLPFIAGYAVSKSFNQEARP